MTNSQIIYNAAKAHGMTDEQLQQLTAAFNGDLPFHTIPEWSRRGYHVKSGEKPFFICDLWKHTNKPGKAAEEAAEATGENAPETDPHFYKKLAYIYAFNQVEKNAPAPDLDTIKQRFAELPGVVLTVKGEKTGAPVVWLTGETDAHVDAIKQSGGIWSNKKQAYYIKPSPAGEAPAPAPAEDKPAPAPALADQPQPKARSAWHKKSFFTIRRDSAAKAPTAQEVTGYTDGVFNYYAIGDESKTWYAIHPIFGLSVATGSTKAIAQKIAAGYADQIHKIEAAPDATMQKYAAMIQAAENGDNYAIPQF